MNSAAPASAKLLKMRRCGPFSVPWAVRRRWLRHIKQHALFLQWVASVAAQHGSVDCPIRDWEVPSIVANPSAEGYGQFASGPAHIRPLKEIDDDCGAAVVQLLTGLPGVSADEILGSRKLFAFAGGDISHISQPWMPEGYLTPPTSSQWWTPQMCMAMAETIAKDKAQHPPSKGFGAQQPAGLAMSEVIMTSNKAAGDEGHLLKSSQQLAWVSQYSAVLPSRPLRQEVENFPQEHSLCETAAEVIRVWEGGGDSGARRLGSETFRNSISGTSRWRPQCVIDVGGGNGAMPWLAGLRLGAPQVVNIERYVTANNIGFGGGGSGGAPAAEIPHTGCLLTHLGYSRTTYLAEDESRNEAPDSTDADGETECSCCGGSGAEAVPTPSAGNRWCEYGKNRWSPAELPYYRVAHRDIREVDWMSDIKHEAKDSIIMTKHLCGAGVDHLLRQMDLQQYFPKYLFINSCCHMKSSLREYINQRYLDEVLCIRTQEVYRCVSRRTSWLHQWDEATSQLSIDLQWQDRVGKCIEGLLDQGRVQWLKSRGYSAYVVEHVPSSITPRNKLLIARRHDGLLAE